MRARSKLSKKRQNYVVEYMPLASMLAKFFVQTRPSWQRGVLFPDLQSEGFLALTKAARTYDQSRLPYPKAYFARAIMNAMYKWIKKSTRTPCEWKMSLAEAEEFLPVLEHPDYLRLAIEDLSPDEQRLAEDRFESSLTLRKIAEGHQISVRLASVRSRLLARKIAQSLDIRLPPPAPGIEHRTGGSRVNRTSSPRASGIRRRRKR
jgi:RNA polymerase sigma factor (sigma-70 family)